MCKTVQILSDSGLKCGELSTVRFISSNIVAFDATGRGDLGTASWNAQRDRAPLLAQFEKVAFQASAKVFLSPLYTFATLDDDLYGTRASDNQVKTLSSRKADREGHTADALCDALFRVTYMVRFRRREETQASCVASMIDALLEGRGERHLSGFTVTVDRGYGKLSTLTSLFIRGINYILIMPDHILKCHPFVRSSFPDVTRNEENDEGEDNYGTDEDVEDKAVSTEENISRIATIAVDRWRAFVVDGELLL